MPFPYQPYRTIFRTGNIKRLATTGVSIYPLSLPIQEQTVGEMVVPPAYIVLESNVTTSVTSPQPSSIALPFDRLIASNDFTWSIGTPETITVNRTALYQIVGNFSITNNFTPGFSAESYVYLDTNLGPISNSTNYFRNVGGATAYGFTGSWVVELTAGQTLKFNASYPTGQNITSVDFKPRTIPDPDAPAYIVSIFQIS